MVKDLYAYHFRSDLTLQKMFDRLNAVGPWSWIWRDNDRWGDYMSTSPDDNAYRSIIKILIDPEHVHEEPTLYAVNVLVRAKHPDEPTQEAAIRDELFNRLLPAIGARDVTKTDDFE